MYSRWSSPSSIGMISHDLLYTLAGVSPFLQDYVSLTFTSSFPVTLAWREMRDVTLLLCQVQDLVIVFPDCHCVTELVRCFMIRDLDECRLFTDKLLLRMDSDNCIWCQCALETLDNWLFSPGTRQALMHRRRFGDDPWLNDVSHKQDSETLPWL